MNRRSNAAGILRGLLDPQFRRALAYVAPYWRRLALVVVLSLASTAASLIVPLLSRDLIDDALLAGDRTVLVRIVALFIGLTLLGFLLNVASGLRYTRVSAEILFDMRLDLYRHLQRLSPRFYARTRLGDIVSRLNNDIGEIQRVAAEAALSWIGNLLFLAGSVGMMIWLDVRLFLAGIAVLPLSVWALVIYRRRLEGRVAAFRERSADIGSFLIETLSAMKLVVTANAQGREVTRFRDRNQAFIGALMAMQRVTYLAGGLPGVLLSGGLGVVFLYGGFRYLDGTLSMGTLVAFMAYQTRLMAPVQGVDGALREPRHGQGLAGAGARDRRCAGRCGGSAGGGGARRSPRSGGVRRGELLVRPRRTHLGGRVVRRRAGGDHGRRRPQRRRKVDRGRPVAPLPGSGSGARSVSTAATCGSCPWRSCVGTWRWWKHAPFVFHASMAENIRYARPDASDADVEAAARAAGIHDFIAGLPEDYGTVVGERGAALSAGGAAARRHRPRVAGRSDRPWCSTRRRPRSTRSPSGTSSTATRRSCGERTTLLITHRLGLARRADRLVALDGARVAEIGSPDELLARGGVFARLFASQMRPTELRDGEPHGAGRGGLGRGARVGRSPFVVGTAYGRRSVWLKGVTSAVQLRPFVVGVIDSGIHANHPHISAVATGAAFDAEGDIHEDTADRLGHGTAVAAAIQDLAAAARVCPLKVFDRTLDTSGRGARRGHRLGGVTQAAAVEPQPGYERPLARRRTRRCRRARAGSRVHRRSGRLRSRHRLAARHARPRRRVTRRARLDVPRVDRTR